MYVGKMDQEFLNLKTQPGPLWTQPSCDGEAASPWLQRPTLGLTTGTGPGSTGTARQALTWKRHPPDSQGAFSEQQTTTTNSTGSEPGGQIPETTAFDLSYTSGRRVGKPRLLNTSGAAEPQQCRRAPFTGGPGLAASTVCAPHALF